MENVVSGFLNSFLRFSKSSVANSHIDSWIKDSYSTDIGLNFSHLFTHSLDTPALFDTISAVMFSSLNRVCLSFNIVALPPANRTIMIYNLVNVMVLMSMFV